jgi:hypothetical protein
MRDEDKDDSHPDSDQLPHLSRWGWVQGSLRHLLRLLA